MGIIIFNSFGILKQILVSGVVTYILPLEPPPLRAPSLGDLTRTLGLKGSYTFRGNRMVWYRVSGFGFRV